MARAESRHTHRVDVAAPSSRRPEVSEHGRSTVLSLQRSAGNRAVQSLVTGRAPSRVRPVVLQRAAGRLTRGREAAAVAFNRAHYDANSVRVIQVVVGVKADGDFGPGSARAVARFQAARGIAATGKVEEPTLDAVVSSCVATANQNYAIYTVADFFALETRRDTLTVRFDAEVRKRSSSRFESGNLRVIRLGSKAMTGAASIRDAIDAELARPAPAVAPAALARHLLTGVQQAAAVVFNRIKFTDPRAVSAIQGAVGGSPDGQVTADTVERLAAFQQARGLAVDGKVDRPTLAQLVTELEDRGAQNSAIRAIVDFYRLDEDGLVQTFFGDTGKANATTKSIAKPGVSLVVVGPKAFAQGFAGLVNTIAHEFEHVRQRRVGISDRPTREFLGERDEMLSWGMDEEAVAGFMEDAQRALQQWQLMPAAQRRAYFAAFVEARDKVRSRLAGATAEEKRAYGATLDGYDAVVKP